MGDKELPRVSHLTGLLQSNPRCVQGGLPKHITPPDMYLSSFRGRARVCGGKKGNVYKDFHTNYSVWVQGLGLNAMSRKIIYVL